MLSAEIIYRCDEFFQVESQEANNRCDLTLIIEKIKVNIFFFLLPISYLFLI